ncbi:MAG: hypothetical protein IT209_02465 [Armatimonadetes bacterium]|nr:hypothetical protein [Armatimonadota bacterium]
MQLTYYADWNSETVAMAGLLAGGDGQCGSASGAARRPGGPGLAADGRLSHGYEDRAGVSPGYASSAQVSSPAHRIGESFAHWLQMGTPGEM